MKKTLLDILFIIIGSFIFALSINFFIIPNELGEGGVTGLTIIFYYLYHWSPGITSFIFNAILLIVSFKLLDKTTTIYTIFSVIFLSLFLHLTEGLHFTSKESLVSALFGGVFSGVGIGLILRVGGTTAGSAILARITNKYLGWNISYGMLFFDVIVVVCSYFIIGTEKTLVTIIMLYAGTKVIDFIIDGFDTKKAVTVVTDYPDEIANQVNTVLNRGVTVLTGYGYYTKNKKEILYIIVSKREIIELKKMIKLADEQAFVTIHNVHDVFGEGFLDIKNS